MIGFYDYTVWMTYASLVSAVAGMLCATTGHVRWALTCLALSGLLDAFDGKVARTKKDRTDAQKAFGVQIDSLCDIVCFGALPVVICYHLGMFAPAGPPILCFYCLAGLIRLAWFNITADAPPRPDGKKYFEGLPITSVAVILPIFYAAGTLAPAFFAAALPFVMLLTGFLFILRFPFPKPTTKELLMIIALVGAAILYILACHLWGSVLPWKWVLRRVPSP